MPDEPELKEEDPVDAIRGALNRALSVLKRLLGKENEELTEEMQEVRGTSQYPAGEEGASTTTTPAAASQQTDAKEGEGSEGS